MRRHLLGMFAQPAFARRPLAVLFVMAVLRHDELRRQGDHLGAPWRNDHRRDGRMRVEGLPLGGLPRETVGTRKGFGGKVSGAIEGEQQLVLKNTTVGQPPLLYKAFQDLKKHRIEGIRHAGIEQVAYLIVTGNLGGIQQGADIVLSLGLLEMALILQK